MSDITTIAVSYGGAQPVNVDAYEAIQASRGGRQRTGGTPTPTPSFTANPSFSGTPTAGQPVSALTFTDGTVANGSVTSRAYLLAGTAVALSYVFQAGDVGASFVFQNTGTGGITASSTPVTVATAGAGTNLPAVSRPAAHSLTYAVNMMGDSTINGTAAPSPAGAPWFQMRQFYTGSPQTSQPFNLQGSATTVTADYVGNGGVGGETSAQGLTRVQYVRDNYPAQLPRTWLFSFGLNDYLTQVTPNPRPWADMVRANYAAMAAIVPGGNDYLLGLTMAEQDTAPGQLFSADHVFHRRDMLTAHGWRAVDLVGALRLVRLLDTSQPILSGGADERALAMGTLAYSYRGTQNYGTTLGGTDYADGDRVPIKSSVAPSNTTDLGYADGTLWYLDSTAPVMYRKTGPSGAGGWAGSDPKHNGRVGYGKTARLVADATDAIENKGPPFAPPQEFRCPVNAAAGAQFGTLVFKGTPTQAGIYNLDGTPSAFYSVDTTGALRRIGTSPLPQGLFEQVIALTDARGTLHSLARIYTVRATGTAPTLRTIATPGLSLAARTNHGIPDTTGFAFAINLRLDALAIATLAVFSRSGVGASPASPATPITFTTAASGAPRLSVLDNTGATICNNLIASGSSFAAGVPGTLFVSLDFATNTRILYLADTTSERIGTLGAITSGTVPLADSFPRFLSGAAPSQFFEAIPTPVIGGIGYLGFWSAPVDWTIAANRRAICNVDGSLVERTAYAALPSGPAPKLEMFGLLGDWLYGTPDGSNGPQTMSITHRARTLMS
jgi:lysophospholipase L1-like esterase